jgi:hypothetical protein
MYSNSNGLAAILGFTTDELLRCASYLPDHVMNGNTAFSEEPREAAFNTAYGTTQGLFEWFSQPENELRKRRFGAGMAGTRLLSPSDVILRGTPMALE